MINREYCIHDTLETEEDSYDGMLNNNKHCSVTILPNHHVDTSGNLHGFLFRTNPENLCRVLPINSNLFECICMFECTSQSSKGNFDENVLRLLNDQNDCFNKIKNAMQSIYHDQKIEEAKLNCVPDEDLVSNNDVFLTRIQDSRLWKPSMPERIGLYHGFVRNKQTCKREHKLFLIIRGGLPSATEELYNLWHDAKNHITCAEFLSCEEVHWSRNAVIRNHSRIAALVSRELQLQLPECRDYDLPGDCAITVKPTSVSFINDLQFSQDRNCVECVSGGCFTERTPNGILLDTNGIDGFWLLCGPNTSNTSGTYGSELKACKPFVMPTICASFAQKLHALKNFSYNNQNDEAVILPDEKTMQIFEKMGFNRNDEIVYLMDIVSIHQCSTTFKQPGHQ